MGIIYFLISIMATTIGAMAGIGGGVIIKPILDVMGDFTISTIGILSSFTVFFMAIVSIIKQIRYNVKLEIRKTIFIGIGSIIGGIVGEEILIEIMNFLQNDILVTIIQNFILAILLILTYIYMNNKEKMKSFCIQNSIACIFIGVMLGFISSFLSIGGGPVNVCVLTIFFSMNTKEAAINSIVTILFSQGAKLVSIALKSGFKAYDLSMLPVMIIGGILGGVIGSKLNKQLTSSTILKVFNLVVIALIILNIYNIVIVFI
ncbi:sulfite exporter TauE/SafE family protein, partial [Clostridium tarantellae]